MIKKYVHRAWFEMPPLIGDGDSQHKRAIGVISTETDKKISLDGLDLVTEKGPFNWRLRLQIGNIPQIAEAYKSKKRFENASYVEEIFNTTEQMARVTMFHTLHNIEIREYGPYHGDMVVAIEFKNFEVIMTKKLGSIIFKLP